MTPSLIFWFVTVFLCAVIPYMPYRQCRAWSDEGYWVRQISRLLPLSGDYIVIRALITLLLRVTYGATLTLFINRYVSHHQLPVESQIANFLFSFLSLKVQQLQATHFHSSPVRLMHSVRSSLPKKDPTQSLFSIA